MKIIDQEMRKRGYAAGLNGSRYVRAAVEIIAAGPQERSIMLTKELYPTIGKAAGVDWRCVERSMRYAVKVARPGRRVRDELYDLAAVVRAYED